MQALNIPLRIVFYQEEGDWVAHCLEFDLLGSGVTQKEAISCLAGAIFTQLQFSIEQNAPEVLFSPAPGEYMRMFAAGRDNAGGNLGIAFRDHLADQPRGQVVLEEPALREYSQADSNEDLALA